MLSHELARELLARRNNDVRIQVVLDDNPGGEAYTTVLVELRDQDSTIDPDLRAQPVVTYDATADAVVIRAGAVVSAAGITTDQLEAVRSHILGQGSYVAEYELRAALEAAGITVSNGGETRG
ncbi:hypothetical protein [Actinoplanes siamensis]|uniref:Uncharacterized protein n=1 Tax=Actinoplanes siamensis TaxID=1223317 RepID=A0A919NCN2_9ACTN|nr:hypothetical protein [Actinoplanes siamensis]GIF08713.1 hypothetical protein Asi03nite_62510 [Actinoplanes siamensis]